MGIYDAHPSPKAIDVFTHPFSSRVIDFQVHDRSGVYKGWAYNS